MLDREAFAILKRRFVERNDNGGVERWLAPIHPRSSTYLSYCCTSVFTLRALSTKKPPIQRWRLFAKTVVPGAGIEPARLAAGDFLTTSTFAARVLSVRGLEHAFTMAVVTLL
jgi:hypothetical protein